MRVARSFASVRFSALSFFNVSNEISFSLLFGDELFTPSGQASLQEQVAEAVVRFVLVR